MPRLEIREAHARDADAIARVHVDTWRSTYRGRIPDAVLDRQTYASRSDLWASVIGASPSRGDVIVACLDGEVVGFASCGRERGGNAQYAGEIYALYVLAAQQGYGVGKRLFIAGVDKLRARGYASMLIWVLDTNPARGFYEHLGGVVVGQREEPLGDANLQEVAYGWRDLGSVRL